MDEPKYNVNLIKIIAFVAAIILLLFGVENMDYSISEGLLIESPVLFETFISVNWFTLAVFIFVYLIPLVCIVVCVDE